MRISNYAEIRQHLARRNPFAHGSCHAEHRASFVSNPTGKRYPNVYDVYSYSTRILIIEDGTVVYFDNRRYSQTTSRLQSLIREAFPDATGGHSDRVVYDY